MPNWCSNGITISHPDPFKVKALEDAMKEGKFLDFVIPVPECLKRDGAASHGGPNADDFDRIRAENKAETGYESWYDFCTSRWGTKWDVDCENVEREDDNTVSAAFESAWAPPIGVYDELVDLGFSVRAYYYEPGMAFVGKYEDGCDDCYEYSGYNSKTVRDAIGDELDDYFGISEEMANYEEEEKDEVQVWYEDGVEKKGLEAHDNKN